MGAKAKEKKAKEKPTSANDAVPPPPPPQPPPLFGGWTGKTPVTLLNEYIQRQQSEGWHRADYSVHGGPGAGYLCIIRLTKQDKKLGQLRVEFKPTATATTGLRFPTAIEARHMAATYTLFRLRANTSLYRMIPPVHRAYWLDLDAIKKEESSAKEWMYAEDPFAAQVARDRDRVDRDRARAQVEETRVRAKETGRHEDLLPGGLRRRWDDLAEVAMSEAQRSAAESVVRTWTATWKLPVSSSDDAGSGAGADKSGGRMGLVKRGFRATHVDEALAACQGDPGRAFEWLCVHVPEDDLPAQVMRRGYHASLVVGSNNSTDTVDELALQLAARRLARSGFALSLCRQALDQAMVMPIGVAESRAAEILVSKLCRQPVPELTAPISGELDAVEEEIEALLAIYAGEDRVSRPSPYQVSVSIRPNDCRQLCSADACLEFWIPVDSSYPELRPPTVTLSSDSLPAYLKLHVAKAINGKLARDGMPVLFDAVSMADECIEQWLANPPPLADLMQGMSSSELTEAAPEQSQGGIVATKRKKGAFNKTNRGPIVDDSRRKEWVQVMDTFTRIQGDPAYRRMQQTRAQLPAASVASALVALVGSNRCVVVSGATGCGKTTQVPQFILDAGLRHDTPTNIVCTQPRRISAIGVASRVADERASSLGDTIGYAVRGESRRSPGTRLLFCTTGVLLRMIASDPSLADVTHVVCDEVHERSVDSDLLLVLLLQTLRLNQTIRLVLMSATAQSDVFAEYFGSGSPVVDIPGRTFPVDDVYIEDFATGKSEADLAPVFGGGSACWAQQARRRWEQMESDEGWMARAKEVRGDRATVAALLSWEDRFAHAQAVDYTLAAAIVRHIHETTDRGLAVLIFMPGVAEIQATIAALKDIDGVFVLPLHAGLSASEQRRVFAKPSKPEQGRKVVVATNIAETSITIDDIGFVVDSGRVRELRHDHQTRVARLTTVLCSQAAAAQRRGRAGRTQPGVCFRMYTRAIHERMPLHADPEILRSP
ncbi:helicase, partial [Coemansia sp. RSA 1836]